MRIIAVFIISFFLRGHSGYAQGHFNDSIMALRVADSLTGTPRVMYSPGHGQRAKDFQAMFSRATGFYERQYQTPFSYRLAVLDSAGWVQEICPFGFLVYDSGWLFLPAFVSESGFRSIYGFDQNAVLDNYAKSRNKTISQLAGQVLNVNALHELGHYFADDNKKLVFPDLFSAEIMASYFSYCYFKNVNSPDLAEAMAFSSFIKQNYQPQFRNIDAMDSLYTRMSIQNFKWLHCNIFMLCEQIYQRHGTGFIDYCLRTFAPGSEDHLTTQQVIELLDKKCEGLVAAWAGEMKRAN